MKNSTLKLTRKIQLLVDLPTQAERKEALDKLYQWQNRAFRAANMMVSHLYVQEMIKDFLYLTERVQYKLVDEKKDELGILQCSRIHTTYRAVSSRFKGEIPTNILSNLKQSLYSSFNKDKMKYWSGESSLRNFRRDMAFPFDMEGISGFSYDEERRAFCFRLFSLPLKTYLGKDYTDKRHLLEQAVKGEIRLCTSHIKLKDGKIFWLPVFEIKKEQHALKPQVVAEASMSLEYPIVVKTGTERLTIGSREEFLYRRLAIQASRKRAQKGATFSKSGKGIKRKLKAVNRFHNTESNYVSNRIHVYSRRLIDFCIKHQAGTLILMNQEDKAGIAKEEEFVLRNWSYYDLITKIKYKAEKAGIEVITD
ncbi:transposase [Salinimicrobium sp. MT39]|uniref:Transposase n=1 Tax=Salinimicrobium profundisediminis TaxID=2994553 RepID=A0A9X3CW63_9FLAO|nr:transposase [Salinimicrobium profundisediminis]MCX2837868.1 transposase [Salinimicrobium profundisediminis]